MTLPADRNKQNQKVAELWGNSWQRLSPKQQQLVGEIMQDTKIVSVTEHLEAEVNKMPLPNFASVTQNSLLTCFDERDANNSIVVTWQSVLAKTTAILAEPSGLSWLSLLFQEFDYQQITKNSINDISAIVRQPADLTAIAAIETQLEELQLCCRAFNQTHSSSIELSLQEDIICVLNTSIDRTKSLGVLGLGAFVLTANLHLLLLREKAKSEPHVWQDIKDNLNNYITYSKDTLPQIFRLSVGKIDKTCSCIKYSSSNSSSSANSNFENGIAEYECRYFDGKDIYIFRDRSERVGYECNKHRLKMFHDTVDRLMQTVVQPVRSTIKIWEKFVVQTSLTPNYTEL
jgi:delta endotoxin, N-terminal domain